MHVPLEIEFDADLKSASYSASWSYLNSTKAQLFGYFGLFRDLFKTQWNIWDERFKENS